MSNNIPNNDENLDEKMQIFSNTDKKLKFLGKMLNNDFSRQILLLLIEKEMTANEIALHTKSLLSLTLYHINQMMQAGIVSISKTESNGKNQPMKYYTAKGGILILPETVVEKAKNSRTLSKSLKGIMKFAAIGFAGIVAWFISKPNVQDELLLDVDPPTQQVLQLLSQNEFFWSTIISLSVILIGLIIERITSAHKNKKLFQ